MCVIYGEFSRKIFAKSTSTADSRAINNFGRDNESNLRYLSPCVYRSSIKFHLYADDDIPIYVLLQSEREFMMIWHLYAEIRIFPTIFDEKVRIFDVISMAVAKIILFENMRDIGLGYSI